MMKLERAYLDNCTIGKLFFAGEFVCYTIERPWKNNRKSISCIPSGTYRVDPYSSGRFSDCYSLSSMELGVGLTEKFHRTHILIHPGNFPDDIQGCIAPGITLHPNTWGVGSSRLAMDQIRDLIKSNDIKQIEIK